MESRAWQLLPPLFGQDKWLLNTRAVFTWLSEEIRACPGFVLPHYVIGSKNSHNFVIQWIRSKIQINRNLFAHVFPRFVPPTCICIELNWFTVLSALFVPGTVKTLVLVPQYSVEYLSRKGIGFTSTTLHDWLLVPLFHPVRSKPKRIVTIGHTFSRALHQSRVINFEFWLAPCIVCVLVIG